MHSPSLREVKILGLSIKPSKYFCFLESPRICLVLEQDIILNAESFKNEVQGGLKKY